MYGAGWLLGLANSIPSGAIRRPCRQALPNSDDKFRRISFLFPSLMIDGAGRRGGRGESPPRKLSRHDAEANSSSRPVVEPWRSKQAHKRNRLSRSSGQSPWVGFHEVHDQLFSHFKRYREADAKHVAVEKALVDGEGGGTDRLAAAKKEHDLANTILKTAAKFYLDVDE
ncbi:hypothetical protein D1007_51152 [Hordeum vulgare]|nr:hypothetical protein D1007_51152 [Hordeum vulgare]